MSNVIKTNDDGTINIACCKPNCNGIRTNAPSIFAYYNAVICDECCNLAKVPVSDLTQLDERRQMGLTSID